MTAATRQLAALLLSLLAVPAIAQTDLATAVTPVPTDLPPPPAGATYVEANCAGGWGGRAETARLMADGRVYRLSRRPARFATVRVSPSRYVALSRRLDRADFDHRTTPKPTARVFDGTYCELTRVKRGVAHKLGLPQAVRLMPHMKDVTTINEDVLVLAQEVTTPRSAR